MKNSSSNSSRQVRLVTVRINGIMVTLKLDDYMKYLHQENSSEKETDGFKQEKSDMED